MTTTRAALDAKIAASEGSAAVDVGFWGGVVPGNAAALIDAGARPASSAARLHGATPASTSSRTSASATCAQAMPMLRDHGLPLLAHAELDLGRAGRRPIRASYAGYLASARARGKTPRSRC